MMIVKIILYYILLLCGLASCSNMGNNNTIYATKGIPNNSQSFSYMYFQNEQIGYLFGVYAKYLNLEELIKNTELRSEIKYERNIYKTIDGGYSWEKIDSFFNGENIAYADNGIVKNRNIYISTTNISNDDRFIDVFSLKEQKVIKRKKTKSYFLILLQGNKKEVYSLESNKYGSNNRAIAHDSDLKIVGSISINSDVIFKGSFIDNNIYAINRDGNEGKLHFYSINDRGFVKEVDLPIYPESLVQKSPSDILLVGNDKLDDTKIKFVNYNISNGKVCVIKEVGGYSIINQLQINDKVVVAFIGNIKGHLVEYDLIYSINNGETWMIKDLEESQAVKPSCLVNDILYIYSSSKNMQKIKFNINN